MIRRGLVGAAAAVVALLLAVAAAAAAVPEDQAVEAYVADHAQVRKARADLEAARIAYERATKVAFAPSVAVSGSLGTQSPRDSSAGGDGQERVANGGLSLTWSPVVPLSVEASLLHGSGLTRSEGGPGEASFEGTRASLETSLALWPPPALQSRSLDADAARLTLRQAEYALNRATQEARLEGRRLYTQVQVAAARLDVARRRLALAQQALTRAVGQQRAGLMGEEGVLQARSAAQTAALTVQKAAATLADLERQLGLSADLVEPLPEGDELAALARQAAERALAELARAAEEWGWAVPVAPLDGSDGVVTGVPSLPEGLVQPAVDASFEVRHARDQLELARRRLEAVQRAWGSASLSASAVTTSTSAQPDPSTNWSVRLSVSLDLFDGGQRRLDEAQAASAVAEAERAVQDAVEQVRGEIEALSQDVATSVLELHAARVQLDLAETQLESVNSRYRRGVASVDSLTEAQLGRAEAALALLEAARSVEIAWQRLLGRLVQPDDVAQR